MWTLIAQQMIEGLVVQPGQQVLIRDHAGRYDVLSEVVLAVEQAGATPYVDLITPQYIRRLITTTPKEILKTWDRHRYALLQQVDSILELAGADYDFNGVDPAAVSAWRSAAHRLRDLEEVRGLPYLLAAIPVEERARAAGMSLEELEDMLLPALAASPEELQKEIEPVRRAFQGGQTLTLKSGNGCELHMKLAERSINSDDGVIDMQDRQQGAVVSNLPAGSIYTTVLETETHGSLFLPGAVEGITLILHFKGGRIRSVEGDPESSAEFNRMLDQHTGEPRRISHIGIGLNPYLKQSCNWIIVDEHIHGRIFIALGENRYMGGQNQSSMNIDYSLPGATLIFNEGHQFKQITAY